MFSLVWGFPSMAATKTNSSGIKQLICLLADEKSLLRRAYERMSHINLAKLQVPVGELGLVWFGFGSGFWFWLWFCLDFDSGCAFDLTVIFRHPGECTLIKNFAPVKGWV